MKNENSTQNFTNVCCNIVTLHSTNSTSTLRLGHDAKHTIFDTPQLHFGREIYV